MGAIVGVRHKKDEDATETVRGMLQALLVKNVETFGIASSDAISIERSLHALDKRRLSSPTVIGYAFSGIMERDRPQPLKAFDAAAVFDGRIYPTDKHFSDAQVFVGRLHQNREDAAKTFIAEVDGDFAFVIAEPERLIVGRDSAGIRPLYYGENSVFSASASERKALWNIGIENVHSFPPGYVAILDRFGCRFCQARRPVDSGLPRQVAMETAARELQTFLECAVEERLTSLGGVAVAFSGGLDSSIIAFLSKKFSSNVTLIHVSLRNQPETAHAISVAKQLDLPIRICIYDDNDVSKALPTVLRLIEEPDPVKASIGIPVYWAAEQAAKMDLRVMLAGQGSDELFAGYRRYVDSLLKWGSDETRDVIFKDIVGMHESNFERDFKICNFHGVELRIPFVTSQLVKFATDLPVELKIHALENTPRKLVLRQAARNLELPDEIVDRPKKAVQYSTGVSKVLGRLSRVKHLSLREYIRKTYMEAMKEMMPDL
jgi:asparagine synthase (glutamine-hydrolysing)